MTGSILPWLTIASLAIVAAALGRVALLVFMLIAAIVAAGEAFRRARTTGVRPAAFTGMLAIAAFMAVASARGERAPALQPAIVAAALGATFAVLMRRKVRTEVTRALMYTMLPVLVAGFAGSYILSVRALPDGGLLVLALVVMVAANEAGRLVHERFRPGRAWEPFAGGALLTLVAGVVLGAALEPMTVGRGLAIGALISVAAPAGRAVEPLTAVPRPGDRAPLRAPVLAGIGGLLSSAPVFFYAFRALAR